MTLGHDDSTINIVMAIIIIIIIIITAYLPTDRLLPYGRGSRTMSPPNCPFRG